MKKSDRERAIGVAMLQAHPVFGLSGWPKRPATPPPAPPPDRDPAR